MDTRDRYPPGHCCVRCGLPTRAGYRGLGRCQACYQYHYRTGRERPDYTVPRVCRACQRPVGWGSHNCVRGYCRPCYGRARRQATEGEQRSGRPWNERAPRASPGSRSEEAAG